MGLGRTVLHCPASRGEAKREICGRGLKMREIGDVEKRGPTTQKIRATWGPEGKIAKDQ